MAAPPAAAQDVFSLPPGTATPTARAPGPVDSDSPQVRTRPAPTATAPRETTAARPSPAAPATRTAPRPAPQARATVRPAVVGTANPAATATPLATTAAPGTSDAAPITGGNPPSAADSRTAEVAPPPPLASDWAAFATGALVGALALLALVGGLVWRRRRPAGSIPETEFEPASPSQQPVPAPAVQPEPQDTPPESAPEPAAPGRHDGLEIALEAARLDASLVATTLAYEITLTNHSKTKLSAIAIEGDMIAAHASLPIEKQIANTAERLELRHALVELAPGESARFKGEMRLPLAAITPIRAGNAAYFVPLTRVRVEAAGPASEPLVLAQTFVVGELPDQPGAALRPFRLDLGPRTFGKLGQRAVN